uniref:Lipid-binding serum glycoprotein C-terminal domain-containing protein n=1 Tax=Odontella aurita TaxID=265563 RepID=A0A7S4JWY7_9STRA|mmetsp:Transcript_56199/g.168257  ORF Transcript_56199/g.168257 Transcript_56199/m.168257 type:complete len:255 (+) Transcript_56199:353-1117(+)|eukprot:CAMPEP_0113552860 /NCGR_PEP_ID=MMETSP0015_2-20120614/15298_1 /TAXON_ID=2838 /ORGANISM="Odontella" /LENGTH=254 /DNA_ID=CAMNT_0000453877 /DNA_START=342 /DNA_END=1106 /DNA_ORIENTATION=- /assembly_acc=CAM_ASM_000160
MVARTFLVKTVLAGVLAVPCSALVTSKTALIKAAKSSVQTVMQPSGRGSGGAQQYSLNDYMQLPAAQYACVPMPLNSSLTRIRGTADEFKLIVPPMKFKVPGIQGVEVRPIVNARVTVEQDRVVIISDSCVINGSPMIEQIRLNDCFDITVRICLTWSTEAKQSITANSNIDMTLDPPGPFAFVPRQITEAIGNRAISIMLGALQKDFMKNLGRDFERWASDGEYRSNRNKLEIELEQDAASAVDESLLAYLKR